MVETNDRRLPVGIQSFEKIRKEGYLYVDKTDIIWQLANRTVPADSVPADLKSAVKKGSTYENGGFVIPL